MGKQPVDIRSSPIRGPKRVEALKVFVDRGHKNSVEELEEIKVVFDEMDAFREIGVLAPTNLTTTICPCVTLSAPI